MCSHEQFILVLARQPYGKAKECSPREHDGVGPASRAVHVVHLQRKA